MSPTLNLLGLLGSAASILPSSTNFAGFQPGAVILPSKGGKADCIVGQVTVNVNVPNAAKLNFAIPNNQTGATQTFVSFVSAGSTIAASVQAGTQSIVNTYSIGASLCYPKGQALSTQSVQFATHGVGFDRTYWDFAPDYSYVDYAASQGYASFIYDRLGQGSSTKADPLSEVQAPVEAEVAHQLAASLRAGSYSTLKPKSVIGVGHSFGSIITESLNANYPSLFDAAVLTGFSLEQGGFPPFIAGLNLAIANKNSPLRFGALPNGYLTVDTVISNQIGFLHYPGFDPEILNAATATKGTATYGEFFTLGSIIKPASGYTGPVMVVNGDSDLPFCAGSCTNAQGQAVIAALYPTAKSTSTTYLAPSCGHGINLQYAAQGAYAAIQKFIKDNGF